MAKKLIFFLVTIAVIVCCIIYADKSGIINNSATYLKAVPDSIVLGKKGGEKRIFIDTDAKRWSIKWCPEWAKARKDGDTLVFNCDYMDLRTTNFDTLYLTAADKELAIPVKQYGRATFIRFVPDTLYFDQKGGTATSKLETDGEKIQGLFDTNVDAHIDDGIVTVTLGPNSNSYELFSYVLIKSDQLEGRLFYRQSGTGRTPTTKKVKVEAKPCPECGGLGRLLESVNIGTGEKSYRQCPVCKGSGRAN